MSEQVSGIDQLLNAELLVVCGPGGVGKTTTAAALGAYAAQHREQRVLVITVDPARRLATALGLEAFGNRATIVDADAWAEAGVRPKGELSVAMLDTKASWDDLVRAHAPDPKTRDAILSNALYQNLTGRFIQSHDYVAMERLHELHQSGDYDLIVVDTPPSRHAIDFLDAPERMSEFFSSRLLKWLIAPSRVPLAGIMSRSFTAIADRILGAGFMGDIAEFFTLLHSMHPGFVARADAVSATLRKPITGFVVVSTLAAEPGREARFLCETLHSRGLALRAVVANRSLPPSVYTAAGGRAAAKMAATADDLGAAMSDSTSQSSEMVQVISEAAASYERYRRLVTAQAQRRDELAAQCDAFVAVPDRGASISDLAGVLRIGSDLSRL